MAKHAQFNPNDIAGLREALKKEKVDINKTVAKAWATFNELLANPELTIDERTALAERIIRCGAAQTRATPTLMEPDAKATPNERLARTASGNGQASKIKDRPGRGYMQVVAPPESEQE